jgi:hypothetical protein
MLEIQRGGDHWSLEASGARSLFIAGAKTAKPQSSHRAGDMKLRGELGGFGLLLSMHCTLWLIFPESLGSFPYVETKYAAMDLRKRTNIVVTL